MKRLTVRKSRSDRAKVKTTFEAIALRNECLVTVRLSTFPGPTCVAIRKLVSQHSCYGHESTRTYQRPDTASMIPWATLEVPRYAPYNNAHPLTILVSHTQAPH